MRAKKGDFEIQQLLGWLLLIIALIVLLWLGANWIMSAASISPF